MGTASNVHLVIRCVTGMHEKIVIFFSPYPPIYVDMVPHWKTLRRFWIYFLDLTVYISWIKLSQ
jgi:hypothetical protein